MYSRTVTLTEELFQLIIPKSYLDSFICVKHYLLILAPYFFLKIFHQQLLTPLFMIMAIIFTRYL